MPSIEIHPTDTGIQEVSIQLSSLGITEVYQLNSQNRWHVHLSQNLGVFSYLEVMVDNEAIYGSPIHTGNQKHLDFKYTLEQRQLYPVATSQDATIVQWTWGVILLGILISLRWRRP